MNSDVLIIGGGMVGCSLALALLRQTSLRIAIVEARPYVANQPHPGFDARSLALAKYSQQRLEEWGLDITSHAGAIRRIKVTDQGHAGQCYLDAAEYQLDALGYVMDLHGLGEQLHHQLSGYTKPRLNWYCPDQVADIEQQSQQVNVTLTSGEQLSTALLVIADGSGSASARQLGLTHHSEDYQQVALISNVATRNGPSGLAFERFTANGPLALLPLGEQKWSLVWTLPPERQDGIMALSDEAFLHHLQQQFGYAAGRFVQVGERYCYPLSLVQSERVIDHRVILMGNAAHALHPIAGQGFNLGLRDVATLADLLSDAPGECGEYQLLRRYQQARANDQARIVTMTDGLVRLFSNRYLPFVVGRNLGLAAMNSCTPLKKRLATQAMGLLHNTRLHQQGENHASG